MTLGFFDNSKPMAAEFAQLRKISSTGSNCSISLISIKLFKATDRSFTAKSKYTSMQ